MGVLSRMKGSKKAGTTSGRSSLTAVDAAVTEKGNNGAASSHQPVKIFRLRIFAMALIVSLGGLIFGYDTGKI